MLIKMFARGIGKGKGPVEYCINRVVPAFDPESRKRIPGKFVTRDPLPVVLRGDPGRTIMLIDSSENKWKYSSGVIAFDSSDNPSDSEIDNVMESFETVAFAGLDKDQYDILWIKHLHEGNVELHFVVPRLELTTGKAMNIAPPGYEKTFDAWRNSFNYEKGWASPAEPERARLVKQDDHVLKSDKARLKAALGLSDDPKRVITEYIVTCIESGSVTNRPDIVAMLKNAEIEVTRQGKDYLSIRPEPGAKPVRLKGALYDERFEIKFDRANAIRAELGLGSKSSGSTESEDSPGSWRNPEADAERARSASIELEAAIGRRAKFNAGRYRQPGLADRADVSRDRGADNSSADRLRDPAAAGIEPGGGADPAAERSFAQDPRQHEHQVKNGVGTNDSSTPSPTVRLDGGSIGTDQTAHVIAESARTNDSFGSADYLPDSVRRDLGLDDIQARSVATTRTASRGITSSDAANDQPAHTPVLRDASRLENLSETTLVKPWYDTIQTKIKAMYDRVRTAAISSISEAFDRVRRGHEALVRSELAYAGAAASLGAAIGRAEQTEQRTGPVFAAADGRIERGITMIQQSQGDELERFKTAINLIEFAESVGYEIDSRESSKASSVLRRGDDKIIVATDADGHGIYFSVRDDSDHGSIIDFVQKRESLNLGQVRKMLRPWVDGSPSSYAPKAPALQRRKPQPTTGDRGQVLAVWSKMQPTNGNHPYLTIERKIEPATQVDTRFVGMVRLDAKGNAVFPHYDETGITGYELKNKAFTGFASGGEKALWHSANLHTATRLVVVESAIDGMSHAELTQDPEAAYVSIGGSMSDKQLDLLTKAIGDLQGRAGTVIIATDNDTSGNALAQQIEALVRGMTAERQTSKLKDWNADLIALKTAPPSAPPMGVTQLLQDHPYRIKHDFPTP